MRIKYKSIVSGLTAGVIYAVIMAGYDYSDGQNFRIWRFVVNFLYLGIFMGLFNYYMLKRNKKKSENEK